MNKGILKFYGFDVEKIDYEISESYLNQYEEISLSPDFLFKIVYCKDNPLKFNIIMGVRIGDSNNERSYPFMVEAILRGYYEMNQDHKEDIEDFNVFFIRNGSAILFPYLRSLITDITSKGRHNPLILPTLNFYQLLEESDLSKYILPSESYREFN